MEVILFICLTFTVMLYIQNCPNPDDVSTNIETMASPNFNDSSNIDILPEQDFIDMFLEGGLKNSEA